MGVTAALVRRSERIIRLNKPSASAQIGMTLAMFTKDGSQPETYPRVHHLMEEGLAATSGLMVDDIVISINGREATSDVIASGLIRDASGDVLVKIRRQPTPSDMVVTIQRPDPSIRLGMVLASTANAVSGQPSAPLIHVLEPDGLAAASGQLYVGDVIKAVNGTPVTTDDEAKRLIGESEGAISLTIARPPKAPPAGSKPNAMGKAGLTTGTTVTAEGQTLHVKLALEKGDQVGINVSTEDGAPVVERLLPRAAAESCGAICVGDTIVTINGEPVSSETEARSKLNRASGEVSLVLTAAEARPVKSITAFWA